MTRYDVIRMAGEAGFQVLLPQDHVDGTGGVYVVEDEIAGMLERFAALVAAEKEQQMIRDGWRQCAEGQRTTQHCGLLDAAVKSEREACAKVCERLPAQQDIDVRDECAAAIRARGEV